MFIVLLIGSTFLTCAVMMSKYMFYFKTRGILINATCYGYELKKNPPEYTRKTYLKVLLKYDFNGQEIISSLRKWNIHYKYKIGDIIPIYILPEKRPGYISIESKAYKFIQIFFSIIGISCLCWSLHLFSFNYLFHPIVCIELAFCLYAVYVIYRFYKYLKPEVEKNIFISTTIETKESLANPSRKLMLKTEDINKKKYTNFNISLIITALSFLLTNFIFYKVWIEQTARQRNEILYSLEKMNYQYFIDQFQNKNIVVIILSIIAIIDFLIVLSYFMQIFSFEEREINESSE